MFRWILIDAIHRGFRNDVSRPIHDGFVDHLSINRSGGTSTDLERSENALRPFHLFRRRKKSGVDRDHLARMNAKLATKAELA